MRKIIIILAFLMAASVVIANDDMPMVVIPQNSTEDYQLNSDFLYNLTFSNYPNCSIGDDTTLYSNWSTITTDEHGVGIVYIDIDSLTSPTNYMCEWRNDTEYRINHSVKSAMFDRIVANNLYLNDSKAITNDSTSEIFEIIERNESFCWMTNLSDYYQKDEIVAATGNWSFDKENYYNTTNNSAIFNLIDNETFALMSNLSDYYQKSEIVSAIGNFSAEDNHTNSSLYWYNMSGYNTTQFENQADRLTILNSWLNGLYAELTDIISMVGNWSFDKVNYYNTSDNASIFKITENNTYMPVSELNGSVDGLDLNQTAGWSNASVTETNTPLNVNISSGNVTIYANYYLCFANSTDACPFSFMFNNTDFLIQG